MDSSLSRSLRSLLAAAALLMAAYAIAASPGTSLPGPLMSDSVSLLSDVKQELGFGVDRQRAVALPTPAYRDETGVPVSSALPWAFAGLCLVVSLAQRRFFGP